jgi:outer membrane protein assembly factor BamA
MQRLFSKSALVLALAALPGFFVEASAAAASEPKADPISDESRKLEPAAEKASDPAKMPYEADLDKIDDKEPCLIKNVTISGNKLISRPEIKALIKVKSGDFYSRKESEADLKAIYNMGYFTREDLHIEPEKTSAGLALNIKLKENTPVKSFLIEGNKVLPTAALQEMFKDQLQKPENKRLEKAVIKKIVADYHKRGFLLASAKAITGVVDEYGDTKNVGRVTIKINEGVIEKVEIDCPEAEQKAIIEKIVTVKSGDCYNENKVAEELRAAFKAGKFGSLDREVVPNDKNGEYTLKIVAREPEAPGKKGSAHDLLAPKKSQALPVLNKYIKTPMYKNIKMSKAE